MRWVDPNQSNLLEEGIMRCRKCREEFKGIPGWNEAMGFAIELDKNYPYARSICDDWFICRLCKGEDITDKCRVCPDCGVMIIWKE